MFDPGQAAVMLILGGMLLGCIVAMVADHKGRRGR